MNKTPINIFWFRRDLRLADNHAFYKALSAGLSVLPIFIFDTDILDTLPDKADKRLNIIYNRIIELNQILAPHGSGILCLHGKPIHVIQQLLKTYTIHSFYVNEDYEPQALSRDLEVEQCLLHHNISFHSFKDQVIFEKNDILKPDNSPYTIFTPYANAWKKKLTPLCTNEYPSQQLLHKLYNFTPSSVITLAMLGFEPTPALSVAQVLNTAIIKEYDLNRNVPHLNATSQLSIALRFGFVSIRGLVRQAESLNQQWLNELIWREFFMMILFHFPWVVNQSFKKKYDHIKWRNNEADYEKWCTGNTGYAIVDAGMRQLNQTGLMHNRVRMIVASFLTKHLLIDWRWGEAYFATKLLDYELSSNNGNWQWAAGCGCDAAPYFRIFNPYEQVKKFDPQLIYIHTWVSNINAIDYPKPMVDHKFARERVLKAYKEALNEQA